MIGRLAAFAIDNARLTLLAILFVIGAGIGSFLNFPSQEDPEITVRQAVITTLMPGMSPERMESLITKPLERIVKQIPEVAKITSTTQTGQSVIYAEVDDIYFDLDPIWQDLRNKMADAARQLPEGTQGPYVNDDFGRTASATVAIIGEDFDMRDMREISESLQDSYATLESVARVDIYGLQEERIWLEMDPVRMAHYGLTPATIVSVLNSQNIVMPGGKINADGLDVTIEPSGNLESIEDLKQLTIALSDTEFVYLQDLVEIRRGYEEPLDQPVFFNNRPAVTLAVSMVDNFNIFAFDEQVSALTEKLRQEVPLGVELEFATYQPVMVEKAVSDATNNLYQTIAIVLTVVMLFLGLRTGLIVGSLVPMAILLSLLLMGTWDIALQRMSIAAIIISLGLLVDNGIVIAEDIKRRMELGEARRAAVINAADSLGIPLLTSSLTTILAFMPLMLAEDVMGEYLRSLSQVIITTLLSSWFLAVFAITTFCYWFLPEPKPVTESESVKSESGFTLSYRRAVSTIVKQRYLFVALMVALLGSAIYGLKFVDKQLMAGSDRNQYLIYLNLPSGTATDVTLDATKRLTTWLSDPEQNPEVTSNVAYIASGGPRFFLALSPVDPESSKAFVIVNTRSHLDIDTLVNRSRRFMAEELPEVNGIAK